MNNRKEYVNRYDAPIVNPGFTLKEHFAMLIESEANKPIKKCSQCNIEIENIFAICHNCFEVTWANGQLGNKA